MYSLRNQRRRVVSALAAAALVASVVAAPAAAAGVVQWDVATYDYGFVSQGGSASHLFTETNGDPQAATSALTISISGSADFSVSTNTCSPRSTSAKKTCLVTVVFRPSGCGVETAMLTATSQHVSASVRLSGSGVSAPSNACPYIYVSAFDGNDANSGSQTSPVRTIGAGITLAASLTVPATIIVASGSYSEGAGIALIDGLMVKGGYDESHWTQTGGATTIIGSPQAALADDAQGVALDHLTLAPTAPTAAGSSVYGLRAINHSTISLTSVVISTPAARTGAAGTSGTDGNGGGAGDNGSAGIEGCFLAGGAGGQSITPGGAGGASTCAGGLDGVEGAGPEPGAGGEGGNFLDVAGFSGGAGFQGNGGSPGAGGVFTFANAGSVWTSGAGGGTGFYGTAGSSGGGGGGGGGNENNASFYTGGSGGGGGAGGEGGTPGTGGSAGGGSFGIYLWNGSVVTLNDTTVTVGNGGTGGAGGVAGNGGPGGEAGNGGGGGLGAPGGSGGVGGDGGPGGAGGGGQGGPSIGIFRGNGSTETHDGATTINVGQAGVGGIGGHNGQNGQAVAIE